MYRRIAKLFSSGVLLAIVGVVLFSAKAVMVKMAYNYPVTSEHLLLFRMLFSLPFYILIAIIQTRKNTSTPTKKEIVWLVFFGFIGYYLASYFDFLGLQYIKAGLERIILFVYPTLVLLLSQVFLKKKITYRQLIAILMTYFGVVIAFWSEIQLVENTNIVLGGGFIFLSALTYACYIVGSGWLIPKLGVRFFTSYAMIVASLCIIIQYLVFDRGDIFNYPLPVYILGFLMGIFSTLIPSFMVSSAIDKLGASDFSIIASIGPISTIILAFFFLGERFTIVQFIGATIVILGIYWVTSPKKTSE